MTLATQKYFYTRFFFGTCCQICMCIRSISFYTLLFPMRRMLLYIRA